MGRQWLHAKRLVAGLKKGRATTKLVKEISVAAKMGGANPDMNPRLLAAIEKARKDSVPKDTIERAIKKGAGLGDEKMSVDHVVYEGYAPHKVPVIVECYTDNLNRTGTEVRVLFKKGILGSAGSNKFLFDHVGLVEAFHSDQAIDREAAAIEAEAQEFEVVESSENDDIPENASGARFICDRTDVHKVSQWLSKNGWTVITAEIGYRPKQLVTLSEAQAGETGEFLQALEDNDEVHRVWAAFKN